MILLIMIGNFTLQSCIYTKAFLTLPPDYGIKFLWILDRPHLCLPFVRFWSRIYSHRPTHLKITMTGLFLQCSYDDVPVSFLDNVFVLWLCTKRLRICLSEISAMKLCKPRPLDLSCSVIYPCDYWCLVLLLKNNASYGFRNIGVKI